MLYLYHGGGSSEIIPLEQTLPSEEWERLRQSACQFLRLKGQDKAADALKEIPFELLRATNGFGDEFSILLARLPLETYVQLAQNKNNSKTQLTFQHMAHAVSEVVGDYVRFVVAALETESYNKVSRPTLQYSSEIVERALADAEHLIRAQGPASSLDRVHTAFHGYLQIVAQKAGIAFPDNASITQVFKAIRENHPAFVEDKANSEEIGRIIRSLASILDAINVLRNRASLAHPNESLLEEPEAMLFVNTVKTLLHYVDSKLKKHSVVIA